MRKIAIGVIVVMAAIMIVVGMPRLFKPLSVSNSAVVQITDDGFLPATLQVPAGTKVTWVNVDGVAHRVVAVPKPSWFSSAIKSPRLTIKNRYVYTFSKSGSYRYNDPGRPGVSGVIVVK